MVLSYGCFAIVGNVADCNRNRSLRVNGSVFVQSEKFYLAPEIRLQPIALRLLALFN